MLPKPPNGYLSRSQANALMDAFVHNTFRDGPVALPKRADPSDADEFVKHVLDEQKLTGQQFARCGELMRFFDLTERPQQLTRRLDRREQKPEDVARSLLIVTLLGELGDAALQQRAGEYYRLLAALPFSEEHWEAFVDGFFTLGESADPKWIAEPIASRQKALEPDVPAKVDTEVAYKKLGKLRENRLKRVLAAKTRKHEILNLKDGPRRQALARLYLQLDDGPPADMRTWAMGRLQHECNASKPAELAAVFAQMLDLLRSPGSVPGPTGERVDRDEEHAAATGSARAVTFYEGQLTKEQAEFVRTRMNEQQNDVLYWEPEEQPADQ